MSETASNIIVISSFVTAVISVAVAVAVMLIYRGDVKGAAKRKEEQNEQWAIELAKVSGVLKTTQELLEAQQTSNRIILETNEKLTSQVTQMQRELERIREELKGVREELRQMTKRAETAEEQAEDKAPGR